MADVRIKYKVDKNELVLSRKELEKINKELGITDKEAKKASGGLKGMKGALVGVGGAIVAAFTVDKLIDFGRQVVAITAEFQKLQAVLTNTLGSKSQAEAAFTRIQKFASETPFAVTQLTASFVKLANQGFVPTNEELRKLGDLAASTGKDFDMLTEAIIDAQVGEFERLKEFGIRASKQGDQVTFAFKGVQTQTEFTQEAIRDYLLSLGDLEGVSGAMSAISKTLGGQISNLGDSFDSLFFALGQASGGIISKVLSALNEAVEIVTRIVNTANGITSNAQDEINKLNQEFGELDSPEKYENAISEVSSRIKQLKQNIEENTSQAQLLKAGQSDLTNTFKTQEGVIDTLSNQYGITKEEADALASSLEATGESITDTGEASQQTGRNFLDLTGTITDQTVKVGALEEFLKSLIEDYKTLQTTEREQTETLDIQGKSVKDLLDRYSELKKLFSDVTDQTQSMGEGVQDLTDKNAKLNMELIEQNDITRRSAKAQQDLSEEEARILDERAAKQEAFFTAVDSIGAELFGRQQQRLEDELFTIREQSDEKLAKLEEERDRAIEAAGENTAVRKGILKKFQQDKAEIDQKIEEKEREVRIKQAKADKAAALFSIAINTAEAIVKVLPNVPLSLIIGGLGAVQAGLVASRPIPKFRQGVLDIKGPSHEGGGILAEIEGHESIMTRQETRDFMPTLKAIRENRIDPDVLNNVASGGFSGTIVNDNSELVRMFKDRPELHLDIDENGLTSRFVRRNIEVSKRTSYFKC